VLLLFSFVFQFFFYTKHD